MNLYCFSLLCFSFGVVLIALLVLVKRRDYIARRFLIFSISVCGWGFLISFWITGNYSYDVTLFLDRLSHIFAVFIPVTWTHFVFDFIGKKEPVKYFYLVSYSISSLLAISAPTPFLISGLHSILDFKYFTSFGPLYHVFVAEFFILVTYAFSHLLKVYISSAGKLREQLKYFVIGTSVGFGASSATFLPIYHIPFPQFLLALTPSYPLLMGIALIRHGLFDVEQIADVFQRDKLAAIGTLATSINHEIRNPLFVIKASAESHLENLKDGIYRDKDEVIERSNQVLVTAVEQCQRAVDIVKRFALFAKQDTKEGPQAEEVNLNETFESILPLVRHEMELDGIEVIKDIPNSLSPIHADRRHVEEIFFNLIVNACQAMKGGGGLTIRAEQRNGNIQVEIQDQGPGISADQLSKIFEPFYTTKESGTGLGLYITKQLVERNHGKIRVKSKIGKGTTFILTFPAVQSTRGVSRVAPPTPTSEAALVKEEMT